jgi:5-methylthioadenosine/S-adenosylhomocysteine deaminase
MDAENPVLENYDLGIKEGKVAYLKPSSAFDDLVESGNSKRIIDATHKVIMPGLYNCHTHAGMTLFRGFANDRSLEDWLFNHLIPAEGKLTPELIRTGAVLAMAEMLASGTVAFSDMYYFMDTMTEAVHDVGMLANLSNGLMGDNGYEKFTEAFHRTAKALPDHGRVKLNAHIHGCYTSAPKWWEQISGFAKEHNLHMHVHLSETKTEHDGCIENYGKTPTRAFADHGVFDVPCLAAHGVWATDDDMKILAEKGVTIAHNPLSNLKLASGLAPVTKMLQAGVNVTLGTDGMASNNSHDLFEELKMASLLQKYITADPTVLPAFETLSLATTNGALAQGRQHESGTIKEGYHADLIMLDFDNERQTMCYNPLLNLAYSTSGRDVQLTMVRGKILYEKGEFTTIDIEKTLHEARKAKEIFI